MNMQCPDHLLYKHWSQVSAEWSGYAEYVRDLVAGYRDLEQSSFGARDCAYRSAICWSVQNTQKVADDCAKALEVYCLSDRQDIQVCTKVSTLVLSLLWVQHQQACA